MVKRGQAAAGAAILLAIVAGLLIGFIILIPPPERAALLGTPSVTTTGTTAAGERHLLSASPGRIDYLTQTEIDHPLPAINVFTKSSAEVLATRNSLYAKKGLFSEESGTFSFSLSDVAHTENILLGFTSDASTSGEILLSLNGEEIFRGSASQTVSIPQSLLQANNQITLQVASPGIAFWKTNQALLKNVNLVGDVTEVEAQSSRNTFLVSETEATNLERVVLRFQPDCLINQVGPLRISVNGVEIYQAVPDCDLAFVPIEFSPQLLNRGENEVIFYASRGNYLLSHVEIQSKLKAIEYPAYYFDLSVEEYQRIRAGDQRLRLQLDFVDVAVSKFGDFVFNGALRHFDTKEPTITLDLSEDVVRGTNSLKIKPKKTIEVRSLKVDLVG